MGTFGQYNQSDRENTDANRGKYIGNFIRILIARRLLIYVKLKHPNIKDLHLFFTTAGNKAFLSNTLCFER